MYQLTKGKESYLGEQGVGLDPLLFLQAFFQSTLSDGS